MKKTAFVSHFDCSRHDTGWEHPEHQGRMPALTRAVYADMLALFDPLLNLEGRPATQGELRLFHSAEYLEQVRAWTAQAQESGRPLEVASGLVASGATWDASIAAVGCAITAIDAVASGASRNAFCAVRPPARDATTDRPGRFGFLNPVAIGVRYLLKKRIAERVLVILWGEGELKMDEGRKELRIATMDQLDRDADDAEFVRQLQEALDKAVADFEPDFVLLSSGFDWLSGDPVSGRSVGPAGFHSATERVRNVAMRSGGRLVSILEGGYEAKRTATAVVQHLRALSDLPPAE